MTNIGLFDCGNKYDIICTDAFLTRFSLRETPSIVKKWYNLLSHDGCVITTVRIHDNKYDNPSFIAFTKDISLYIAKVQDRFKNLPANDVQKMNISLDKLSFLAFRYILRMKSNYIGDISEVKKLFENSNFVILAELSSVGNVPGEIRQTKYYRVVAKRED